MIADVDRPTARAALTDAVDRRTATKAADEEARLALDQAIRDGYRSGLTHSEIATLTGLHRNMVSRIIGDTERD